MLATKKGNSAKIIKSKKVLGGAFGANLHRYGAKPNPLRYKTYTGGSKYRCDLVFSGKNLQLCGAKPPAHGFNYVWLMDKNTIAKQTETVWMRIPEAVRRYGISRTKFFLLAKDGKIRSVSLREPGTARGTRLFCAKSIEAYIESFLPESTNTTH